MRQMRIELQWKDFEMRYRAALATVLLAMGANAASAESQPIPPTAASRPATGVRPTSATAPAAAASGSAGYRSAFEGYRGFGEQPVESWREANDLVGRIGGWQAYAREGQGEEHDMGAMKNMPGTSSPGTEPKSGDAPAGNRCAAGHDMGSMKAMPGMSMPGMESKPTGTPVEREGAVDRRKDSIKGMAMPGTESKTAAGSSRKESAGHDMGSMRNMPDKATAGTEHAAGHDMSSMKVMPGKAMPGMSKPDSRDAMSKEGHKAMAIGKEADDSSGRGRGGPVTGTAVVRSIDKANGKVNLTHDPIAALGWPRMTMFFRLKDSGVAEKVKEGDSVAFSLEKSASGYVISSLEQSPAPSEARKTK